MSLNIDIYKHLKYVENSKDEFTYEPVRTTEDITVYKLLRQFDTGVIKTLYEDYPISFNKDGIFTYPKIDESLFSTYELITFHHNMPCKSKNSYHAIIDKSYAQYRKLRSIFSGAADVYKATIPIGSLVWFGQNGDICSNQLIIKQEIIP